MFIASLISNPQAPVLEATLVESLRNAWGGGEAVWLNPGIAAEFTMPAQPGNLWEVWREVQALGVDLAVQPAQGRKKKMLLADMDSTMIQQECIDELAAEAGVGEQVASITARAMNGEIDFEGALKERVRLLAGMSSALIDTVLGERITFMPGGLTLVSTMRANGAYAALVSGGFTAFTDRVMTELGFDENRANRFVITDEILTGDVKMPILGREAKVEALEQITKSRGLSEGDVLAVGDGANDLGMLLRAGTGVALHAKPVVQEEVSIRINHGDLTALLYLQGYRAVEFAG
ncbi:MAG: phosphoserine phosphatase SerB [Litoreibacter sp.]|nr:phosphoserine phosphatase SerB [Litoreibacter sp.]